MPRRGIDAARSVIRDLDEFDLDFYANLYSENRLALARAVPKTRDDLHTYIQDEYGYNVPQKSVCRGHCSPFDAIADAFFATAGEYVWVGPRTGGKTLGAALLEHAIMTHFGDTVAHGGAIDVQAMKCYEYLRHFFSLPQFRDDVQGDSLMSGTRLKNGAKVEVLPMTMNRLNSPHTRFLFLDEIELTTDQLINEARSIPMRVNGRAPLTIFTSSRKKAHGPMERVLREARKKDKNTIRTWCLFEIIETCPPERHGDGVGCASCKLEPICREKNEDTDGLERYEPGPGKAARAEGWYKIDDAITKYEDIDEDVFKAQWLSQKPETRGLAYPKFDEDVHVIDYEYNPAFPVVCGIDFGYTNPSVALYLQQRPDDTIVIFSEDYKRGRTADELAESIKRERWFANTSWRVADSADRGSRETLKARGVYNEPSNKAATAEEKSSVVAGINLVRWLLSPQGRSTPILYVARGCENTIREFGAYRHPDEKEDRNMEEAPLKADDHAMDAMRYALRRAYRGSVSAG